MEAAYALTQWFQIIINEGFHSTSSIILQDVTTLKQLSLVNKQLSDVATRFMQNNFYFMFRYREEQLSECLMSKVKRVIFSEIFDPQIHSSLFQHITHLIIGGNFNQDIGENNLPSLKYLTFANEYNRPIQNLPSNITNIQFGTNYNQPLRPNSLPPNLISLKFGFDFNHVVSEENLPSKLTHLHFSNSFNQPIQSLPKTLIVLKFGLRFNYPIPHNLPKLTHLTTGKNFQQDVSNLPPQITRLKLGYRFNLNVDSLPVKLTHLEFGWYFDQAINKLPQSLIYLKLGNNFSQPIDFLPSNLIQLEFGRRFDYPLIAHHFTKLTRLILSKNYRHPTDDFPPTVVIVRV
eukprot:TRINITY_DN5735_c0_g1_i2.p1 TRINITY_DN5735_c0_g1~~TRINITY_DN5735_c0_g1_i2.p1  ORF type:complete len:347 (-),score=39.08 TRINITY_DN5735_c0_g1_i2:25-1065(-)